MTSEMKKMRCRKELGIWYYTRITDFWKEVAPFYQLFDSEQTFIDDFDTYAEMRAYIENHTQM